MKKLGLFGMLFALFIIMSSESCEVTPETTPTSSSGVAKATTKVATDLNGHTSEQINIIGRYAEDNKPGSIKHLYIINTNTGDVLLYSTVRNKVTSSGKRLTPNTVSEVLNNSTIGHGFGVDINGTQAWTQEVLQDDGTYGTSIEYIYWFDSRGTYHQQYISGDMMVHVSSQPMAVKHVIFNLELPDAQK